MITVTLAITGRTNTKLIGRVSALGWIRNTCRESGVKLVAEHAQEETNKLRWPAARRRRRRRTLQVGWKLEANSPDPYRAGGIFFPTRGCARISLSKQRNHRVQESETGRSYYKHRTKGAARKGNTQGSQAYCQPGEVRILPPFPQQLPSTTAFNKFKDTKNSSGAKTKLEHLLLHNLISSKSATPLQAITAVEPSQSLALVLLVDSEVMPLPSELPRQSPAWSSPPPEVALPNIST